MADFSDPPDDAAASADAAASGGTTVVGAPGHHGAAGPPTSAHWSRPLRIALAAMALWLLFDAPTLQHNAQVSVVGNRRTVALDTLGPIAVASRGLQLSRLVSLADDIIGRSDNQSEDGSLPAATGPTKHPGRSTPTTTTLPPVFHPTAKDPLRVLVIGDSLGIDLGDPLVNDLSGTGVVMPTLVAKESTGLTRPDYYNWPAELQSALATTNPQLVVIMIGANDAQDFPGPPDIPYGTPLWKQTYRQRAASFMQEAASTGARVIWVGMPPMQNPSLSAQMVVINRLDRAAAEKDPEVTYLPVATLVGTPEGAYAPYIEVGGQEVNVREPDGIHLTPGGSELISKAVMAVMRTRLRVILAPA